MDWFTVKSGQTDYPVAGFDDFISLIAALNVQSRSVILVDRNIARLYEKTLKPITSTTPTLLINATEDEKTMPGINRVLDFFQQNNCTRNSAVLAIGGGITQDITTFASHLYYRGIKWFFVPTTLLSMSDSCIGAKCGINLNEFKNQLGVFHSPSGVYICNRFLDTLSDADILSGYGEILKLSLTDSKEYYNILKDSVDKDGFRNRQILEFIRLSLATKKQVIEIDEYETDLRRTLNYGHTFGHALEAITSHEVPHGTAVAWGIDVANYIAWKRGILSEVDYTDIHKFVARNFSQKISHGFTSDEIINYTRRDKKVSAGILNMALLERPGRLIIAQITFDAMLVTNLTEYLDRNHVIYWS